MGVTTQESSLVANATAGTFNSSVDGGGRVHASYFSHTQDGAGDATSSVALVKLPAGRVRLMLGLSMLHVDWTTGSATLDLGWDAYVGLDGVAVVADPNGLIDGLDVDTAGRYSGEDLVTAITDQDGGTKLFTSQAGVTIRATSQDVALATSSAIAGYLAYLKE